MSTKPLRALIAVLAVGLFLTVPAVTGAATTRTVVLRNIAFSPKKITIRHGDRVTWVWRDGGIRHNVVGKGFRSRTQGRGSFTVRFHRRGTYRYRCTLHIGMSGIVVVR